MDLFLLYLGCLGVFSGAYYYKHRSMFWGILAFIAAIAALLCWASGQKLDARLLFILGSIALYVGIGLGIGLILAWSGRKTPVSALQ